MELSDEKRKSLEALLKGKKCPFCGSEYKLKENPYFLPAFSPAIRDTAGDGLLLAVCQGCKHTVFFQSF